MNSESCGKYATPENSLTRHCVMPLFFGQRAKYRARLLARSEAPQRVPSSDFHPPSNNTPNGKMAKTTAKRKSESQYSQSATINHNSIPLANFVNGCFFLGALPTGKTKQRKTSKSDVRKALESDLEGSQSGQELFVQEQSVAARHIKKGSLKSRKSEPARAYRDTEYEDDPLRTESQ